MGMIAEIFRMMFGGGGNVIRETAEVFRENAEAGAQRTANARSASMAQFAAEFVVPRKGIFDRLIDGLNRLPRPALAFGVIGLFASAMVDPVWFSERMQGLVLVPEPLWWLLGVIVSFYFGARWQAKSADMQRDVAAMLARAPAVVENVRSLRELAQDGSNVNAITPDSQNAPYDAPDGSQPAVADTRTDVALEIEATRSTGNKAVDDWMASKRSK